MIAAVTGNGEIVETLLEHKADVAAIDKVYVFVTSLSFCDVTIYVLTHAIMISLTLFPMLLSRH